MEIMKKAHVMMVPYPAQGHVIPMLELAHILAKHHVKITFVNVEFIHDLVTKTRSRDDDERIRFVSVADGLEPEERFIPEKFIERVWKVLPRNIEKLVEEFNEKNEEKVTCLLSDYHLCRIEEVAKKLGIQSALFSVIPAAIFPMIFNVSKLIQDGIIDEQGNPLKKKTIQFSATMPKMNPSDFIWYRENKTIQNLIFNIMRQDTSLLESADWLLCNSTYDLEQGAFALLPPHVVPIGPLLEGSQQGHNNPGGHFIEQDSECLEWLDQQPPCSVIYVAFGSTAVLSNAQFQELGLGLEQTNRPFLWVVRPHEALPGVEKVEFAEGFLDRVSSRGRITGWAPQQKVLSHPSVACFVTHCGWNSTTESLSNGVPMLCWPYFADQFINRSYICDIWRVGLRFDHDDHSGNVTSEEFKKKIDLLLGDDEFKERAMQLKKTMENTTKDGGNSYKNLRNFLTWINKY